MPPFPEKNAMWVPSGEKSGLVSPSEPLVTRSAWPPAVCCTQMWITPLPAPDTYASSLPSRESVEQQKAADAMCVVSDGLESPGRFAQMMARIAIATSTPAVSIAMIGTPAGRGLAGPASETEPGGIEGCATGTGAVTGAIKRYPRRGHISWLTSVVVECLA
jgi:hypothetical protein